jgi:iron-sulfur cluster assembly protein
VGEFGGVKVVVDEESAAEVRGVSIDYVETVQGSGFTITKPHARKTCGCGGAFHGEGAAHEERRHEEGS